jgi:nicotinic acid phosphoribosyltransferase
MRREPDFLGDEDGKLLYIAKKLREAKALENLLTAAGIDYIVEVDQYLGGFLFRTTRAGAFFYVRADSEAPARDLLSQHGYRAYEPPA